MTTETKIKVQDHDHPEYGLYETTLEAFARKFEKQPDVTMADWFRFNSGHPVTVGKRYTIRKVA